MWVRAVLALALLWRAGAELVFRVPEVMVRHTAAPRAVGSGPNPKPKSADSQLSSQSEEEALVSYEEYYMEHDVATVDARRAAKMLDLDTVPSSRAGCGPCSRREREYCGWRVLADHCCCERRFLPEPFPWLPHSCYVGPRACRPAAGDCARYARLRDCCCYRVLAEKWKGILSSSPRLQTSMITTLLFTIAMATIM